MTRDPIRDALTTENEALRSRLANAQATIEALADALGRQDHYTERAAFAALEEWVAERKRPLIGEVHEPAPFDRTGAPG